MAFWVLAIIAAAVAVILLIASFLSPKRTADGIPARGVMRVITAVLIILAVVFTIFGSFFSQDVGQSSVVVDWTGTVQKDAVDNPGIHEKAPWEHTETYDIRNQKIVFLDPNTSTGAVKGQDPDGREIAVTDVDGVTSNVDITVRYNIDPSKVVDIYKQYKTEDNLKQTLLFNDVRSVVRAQAGKLHTLELLTDRNKFQDAIREALDAKWAPQGVLIDEVALQQIDPPKSVKDAYAKAQKSQIEVQKATNDLNATRVSAQQQVVQATAAAQANALLAQSLTPEVLEQHYLDTLNAIGTAPGKNNLIVVPQGFNGILNTAK